MTAQGTPEHRVIPFPGAIRGGKGIPAASSGPPDLTERSNVIPIRRRLGSKPVSGSGLPQTPDSLATPQPATSPSLGPFSSKTGFTEEEWEEARNRDEGDWPTISQREGES